MWRRLLECMRQNVIRRSEVGISFCQLHVYIGGLYTHIDWTYICWVILLFYLSLLLINCSALAILQASQRVTNGFIFLLLSLLPLYVSAARKSPLVIAVILFAPDYLADYCVLFSTERHLRSADWNLLRTMAPTRHIWPPGFLHSRSNSLIYFPF